jgi:hypothetical protein
MALISPGASSPMGMSIRFTAFSSSVDQSQGYAEPVTAPLQEKEKSRGFF